MSVPITGYIDKNVKTIYHTGKNFVDFSRLNLNQYDPKDILCFFDCHQDAYARVKQCKWKGIRNILLNDNYPLQCGSHFTIEHLIHNDPRFHQISPSEKDDMLNSFLQYHIFPNIYPGDIKTNEGLFACQSFFPDMNDKYEIFKLEQHRYRWNTFIRLNTT